MDVTLTHFQPMFHFHTPRKHQKTVGFFMFSGVVEVENWLKMGEKRFAVFRKAIFHHIYRNTATGCHMTTEEGHPTKSMFCKKILI